MNNPTTKLTKPTQYVNDEFNKQVDNELNRDNEETEKWSNEDNTRVK